MKYIVYKFVLIAFSSCFVNALTSEEVTEISELCCTHAQTFAVSAPSVEACAKVTPPEYVDPDQMEACTPSLASCCKEQFKEKDTCAAGMKLAPKKQCSVPESDTAKACCEECSFGRLAGASQGKAGCGSPAEGDVSPSSALKKNAYYQCCLEAVEALETTTEKKPETTTKKEPPKEKCAKDSCEHICNDETGVIKCQCNVGYRLHTDNRTCKDINECAEAVDDVCTADGTVCHNTVGAFKCVPIKKRDVGLSCPPGFKRNILNQVCDDINECQLPRPPCPKYLCENTIGGYKCAGKPGKPVTEAIPGAVTEPSAVTTIKNDICPPGFRAGPDDECLDIDECEERLDDCQRLSQHCINTHGNFFCQDHVSKRCAPGFKVNTATGICEDIDECEESSEVCKRTEICINLPGAYNCKSKISTLPKLAKKTCQEGTRVRPGGTICEDIDECREGTHLCDQFQNCINTYGAHECRCKNGFELDSSTGSCVDIDECALKLDNCAAHLHCLNVLGTFTCTYRPPSTTTTTTTLSPPLYEYEYYDSEEENSASNVPPFRPVPVTTSSTTTRKPTTTSTTTTPKPTTTSTTTTTTTTPAPTTTSTVRPRPYYPYPRRPTTTTRRPTYPSRRPYTPRRPDPTPARPVPDTPPPENRPDPTDPDPSSVDTTPTRPEYPTRPDTYPRRPSSPSRPSTPTGQPTTPTRPQNLPPRPYYPTEVTVPQPENPTVIEKHKDEEGVYNIDTDTIPKDTWNNVIGRDKPKPSKPDFDAGNLHCLNGYEKDAYGHCVDVNECEMNRHICNNLEDCVNQDGGYYCDCIVGYHRNDDGWCVPAPVPTTTSTTTSTTPSTTTTTTSTTTEKPTAVATPEWPYTPARIPPRDSRVYPPVNCELGYVYDRNIGACVDVDECATNKATCAANEDCMNIPGGFRCVCGKRCRAENEKPTYTPTPSPAPRPADVGNTNVITVGAQYGQRGPWSLRPTYSRLPDSGAIVTSCPWGYKLTGDKRCFDIDECARNVSDCGPMQRCENFYGGYSCQCPAGHRLVGQNGCDDIDECMHGNPCSYNAQCVNTVGSYKCVCSDGFRNAPSNDKVCVDIDECMETPSVCHQGCANAWGSYRCYCERGYRLGSDNRTCVDVDECEEWGSVRVRGKLCAGECVNEPGSYRCACPAGYRLSEDGRSCIDIDECETGEAPCARTSTPGYVCQNTQGSYHCHRIECPAGYRLESKHRCTRVQRACPVGDWTCLEQPSAYSYNFITFVANLYLPTGSVDLFTMHGPSWRDAVVSFEMRMLKVQASPGVQPADLRCFDMRPSGNICVISLLCSLQGPQVAELELTMSLYQRSQFAGSAVARLIVIVSEYEF